MYGAFSAKYVHCIPFVYDHFGNYLIIWPENENFYYFLEASPNWIPSDKLIIYSGFEGENRNELQARQCEPPGRVLEAPVPSWKAGCSAAGPWEAAEGEAAQGAARGRGKGKERGWEEACGAPEVPSNSKINPQTPSRTEIESLINCLKVWSWSDRKRTIRSSIVSSSSLNN